MANRRFIDFPIASTVGDNDIVLIWQDGANKQTTKATILSGLPENLEDLNDVVISGLTNGQILRYDSVTGKWENTDQGNLDLNDLNDVSIVSPSNGQVLVYNSSTSKWENSSGGFVPYVGAVTTVDLGAQGLRAGYVRFDTSVASVPDEQGLMYWDASRSTAALIMNGTLQHIGQDTFFYVKNSSGSNIPKGTCVRFAGTDGASGHLLIATFLANGSVPSSYFMGVTAEAIANGSFGQVMHFGELEGINTSGFTAGALLYASTTVAGGFQTTVPVAPNNIVLVAAAVNSKNNGAIIVRPQIGSNINNDEGVKITSPTTGDLLQLQAGGLWENKTLAQVIGSAYVPSTRTITINGVTQDLSANRTYNVGTVTSVGLSSATSGVTIGSTPVTTSGTITLAIATASGSQNGLLSSTDWTTFNNKQNALTNPVTGTGTINTVPKFTGTTSIGDSSISDNNTEVNISKRTFISSGVHQFVFTPNLSSTSNRIETLGGLPLEITTNGSSIGLNVGGGSSQFSMTNTSAAFTIPVTSNGQAATSPAFIANNSTGGSGTAQHYINFTAGTTTIARMLRGNGASGLVANGLNIDNFDGFGVRLNQLGGSGGTFSVTGGAATFSSSVTATSSVTITRSATTNSNGLVWSTSGSADWYLGSSPLGNSTSDLSLYSYGTNSVVLNIVRSTGAATFSSSGIANATTKFAVNGAGLISSFGSTGSGTDNYIRFVGNTNNFDVGINGTYWGVADAGIAYRLLITQPGNVLIGTNSDNGARLQVSGTATFSSSVTAGTFLATDATGSAILTTNGGGEGVLSVNTANPLRFFTNGSEKMRITSGGNVGIGTSSPSQKLVVQESGDAFIQIRNNSVGQNFFIGALNGETRLNNDNSTPITMWVNGSERMRITSSGNLGLGVTPSAWGVLSPALEMGTGGSFISAQGATSALYTGTNAFFNGSNWIYKTNGAATYSIQNAGQHQWFTAPSGTAGNAISFTQAMTLNASGNLLVGTTTDAGVRLQVNGAVRIFAGNVLTMLQPDNANGFNIRSVNNGDFRLSSGGTPDAFNVTNSGNVGIGTTSPSSILDVRSANVPRITLVKNGIVSWFIGNPSQGTSNDFSIGTDSGGNTHILNITAGSNVGIGTTSPDVYGFGASGRYLTLQNTGGFSLMQVISNGTDGSGINFGNATIRRASIDALNGSHLEFYTNGTNSGTSISPRMRITSSGNVGIGTTSPNKRLQVEASVAGEVTNIKNTRNNSIGDYGLVTELGTNDNNTNNYHYIAATGGADRLYIYGNGNVVNTNGSYGTLSDISLKENIVDATPKLADLLQLKVRNFNLIGSEEKQIGFIAQELEEIFPKMVDVNGINKMKSIKTSVLVPMLVKAIQELKQEIDTLKN